jgi:hypothetical protein
MEITSSVVLPVNALQMAAFSTWIKSTYPTYDGYMGALKAPAMDTYIAENILPIEMKTALRISEPFIGDRHGDANIQRLLLDRRRVLAKMRNLKGKIGTVTFPLESAEARRMNGAAATGRREARVANLLRDQQIRADFDAAYAAAYEEWNPFHFTPLPPLPVAPRAVIVQLSPEEEGVCMDGDCGICLVNHTMTDACVLNCGHQFGSKCMSKWTSIGNRGTVNTCPLCRTAVTEITEFIV